MKNCLRLLAMVGLFAGGLGVVRAGDPPVPASTTITIPDMDCAGCAKKLGTKLTAVQGVAKAEYNVEARFIRVTHAPNTTPSPRALWEAVEKGDKAPSKLEGPSGTFTAKPAK